jgi:hypothetical protein
VVLEFMDPHRVDVCPIVSQEFIDAYHDLGHAASRPVFAAVNVNRYHLGISDVAAYSRDHQLAHRARNADIVHASEVVFIDPAGRERYIDAPRSITPPRAAPTCPPDRWPSGDAVSRSSPGSSSADTGAAQDVAQPGPGLAGPQGGVRTWTAISFVRETHP